MAMTKFQKFLSKFGINSAASAGVGAKLVGPLSYLNSENLGGYLNPNVIDGYSYSPADGKWYEQSIFDGSFDFSKPASSNVSDRLSGEKYWREVHNKVEGTGPGSTDAGTYDSPSIFDIFDKLPEIIDRYKEISPDLWEEFKDYSRSESWGKIFTPVGTKQPSEEVPICYRDAKNWRQPVDPLMLDLDGDGLELHRADGQVLFDHDADGIKTGTGWIGSDDGILVRDLNGDGRIDSGLELFGTDTVKSNGEKALDGFDALADLDSNGDGQFTAADLAWNQVQVWRDLDQDGISDAGELFGLDQLGISRIGVVGSTTNATGGTQANTTVNGNLIAQSASFTQDGVDRTVGAIDLDSNPFYREFTTPLIENPLVQDLPDMQGSGRARDLREAAGTRAELAAAVAAFAMVSKRDVHFPFQRRDDFLARLS